MHSQRQLLCTTALCPFSSRHGKSKAMRRRRRALSISAAQADVVVREKRGKCQYASHVFSISHLCISDHGLRPRHARELFPHVERHSDPMQRRSVALVCCAARQGSDEAVLVVGAGIAGLATAAALHKVLPTVHPEHDLPTGVRSAAYTIYQLIADHPAYLSAQIRCPPISSMCGACVKLSMPCTGGHPCESAGAREWAAQEGQRHRALAQRLQSAGRAGPSAAPARGAPTV